MARGVVRTGIDTAGGTELGGSPNVFVNGAPAVRVGDPVSGHGPGPHSSPVMASGSSSVIVNGIPVCRTGDAATCGHAATGSPDVFAG
jgi:uncharacterized Zn-binding protein involved in type VI secretion